MAITDYKAGVNPGVVGMHVKDVIMDPDLGFKAIVITLKVRENEVKLGFCANWKQALSCGYLRVDHCNNINEVIHFVFVYRHI
jgi:hypothetical protein